MAFKKWSKLSAGAFLSIGLLAGCGDAEEENMEPEVEEDTDVNLEKETEELKEEAEDLGEEVEEGIEDAGEKVEEVLEDEEADEDKQ